ncbi:MAG: class I SAM-dependent methyltransferase [Aminivibrio sp.]|jgi:cyclopropane fatty-acyl-phospholipid synthase-like methyltransferase
MNEAQIQLLIDLHKPNPRQGPGGEVESRLAMGLAGLDRSRPLKVADIGCGTGASAILLARELDAQVTAADFLPEFLDELQARAEREGLADRITALNCSMDALPFADGEYDVIWSEGAVYNMGFKAGISAWRRFLKPGGKLVVSEITWLTAERPSELEAYWKAQYAEIDTASAKMAVLEQHGYRPQGYFALPEYCWLENYYYPLQGRFDEFMERIGRSGRARAIVEEHRAEIAMYEKFRNYYGYGVYVAKKLNCERLKSGRC